MISFIKRQWTHRSSECKNNPSSFLLLIFIGIFEDVLLWKKMWLSLYFIFLFNIVFLISLYQHISFWPFAFCLCITILTMDAFETWLKYKHRTTFLKKLANHNEGKLRTIVAQTKNWISKRCFELMNLRETNHTKAAAKDIIRERPTICSAAKLSPSTTQRSVTLDSDGFVLWCKNRKKTVTSAFLVLNMMMTVVFLIGKYINSYLLVYLIFMFLFFFNILAPPLIRLFKKIQQNADSDCELEGLIPEVTDANIKILSVESECSQTNEDKQILDWKPEEYSMDDTSESSENSSSVITNLSIEKIHDFENDVGISDSSDEDEYIPIAQMKDQLQSTLTVTDKPTWSGSAYNAFWSFTDAVSNMVYTTTEENSNKRVQSKYSSDGFEIIDENDLH